MFQSVRPNSQVFIFHKTNNPSLEVGYVTNQPLPKPKYSIPQNFGQPQEMVVDLVVKVGNNTINLKLFDDDGSSTTHVIEFARGSGSTV